MKVNSKILSIPPYISSSWEHISTLHVETENSQKVLIILLENGSQLKIPGLSDSDIIAIFNAHAQYLEENDIEAKVHEEKVDQSNFNFGIPIAINPESLSSIMEAMQNPEKLENMDIPDEVINKIASFVKSMGLDESSILPAGEFSENSLYGKLKKALDGDLENQNETIEEEVSDEDLKFREWDIELISDKLYKVSNPLDKHEEYQVYLGEPIGCTCGQKNCEHLKAVLQS